MQEDKKEYPRVLGEAYTQIRIVDDKNKVVAVIDEYSATPLPDGWTVVITPNYDYKD